MVKEGRGGERLCPGVIESVAVLARGASGRDVGEGLECEPTLESP